MPGDSRDRPRGDGRGLQQASKEGFALDGDIEVVDDPALMQDGGDPQLDRAIAQMVEELKTKPYVAPKRPPYPDRRGMGLDPKDR